MYSARDMGKRGADSAVLLSTLAVSQCREDDDDACSTADVDVDASEGLVFDTLSLMLNLGFFARFISVALLVLPQPLP